MSSNAVKLVRRWTVHPPMRLYRSSCFRCRILHTTRMRLLRVTAVLVLSFAPAAALRAQVTGAMAPPLSPRNANYSIDVRLDAVTRTVTGSEVITWRNITTKAARDLQFHLYWNAWRDDRSTWQRERKLGRSTVRETRPEDRSRIDIASVRLTGSGEPVDLTPGLHFIAPDDGNADDHTVLAAPLPQPAPPDGTLTIEVKWTAHVPRTFARTGAIGNF